MLMRETNFQTLADYSNRHLGADEIDWPNQSIFTFVDIFEFNFALLLVLDSSLNVMVFFPLSFPQSFMDVLDDTVARANFGWRFSKFYLNKNKGLLAFHSKTILKDHFSDELIDTAINKALTISSRYCSAFQTMNNSTYSDPLLHVEDQIEDVLQLERS